MTSVSSDAGRRTTPRLRLEPIGPASARDLWTLYQDPGIAAWLGGPWTHEQVDDFVGRTTECWQRHGIGEWIAYDRGSGALVGRGGPSITDVLGGQDAEIGWAVRRQFWGRGYATEIGTAALHLVDDVLGVDEVIAFTEVHNRRSRTVMERLGMSYRREIRRPGLVEGRDGVVEDAPFALYALARGRPERRMPLSYRDDDHPHAVPASWRAEQPRTVVVDGETFVVGPRPTEPGTYDVDWTSGPNEGYGFSTSGGDGPRSPDGIEDEIRAFLSDVDPETGYLD